MSASAAKEIMGQLNSLENCLSFEKFDPTSADKLVDNLYLQATKIIFETFEKNNFASYLFPISLKIISILRLDNIQQEGELLYRLSKITRLFTYCIVWKSLMEKRPVYEETKNKQLREPLQKVLGIIPDKDVITHFEIENALKAVSCLDDDVSTRTEIIDHVMGLVHLVKDQSFETLLLALRRDVSKFKHPSFLKTLYVTWSSISILNTKEITQSKLVQFNDSIEQYKEDDKVALCALESIVEMLKTFPKGDIDTHIPSLTTFVHLQLEHGKQQQLIRATAKEIKKQIVKVGKLFGQSVKRQVDSFWKVRYRTVQHLIRIIQEESTPEENRRSFIKALAERYYNEEVTYIIEEIDNFAQNYIPLKTLLNESLPEAEKAIKATLATAEKECLAFEGSISQITSNKPKENPQTIPEDLQGKLGGEEMIIPPPNDFVPGEELWINQTLLAMEKDRIEVYQYKIQKPRKESNNE